MVQVLPSMAHAPLKDWGAHLDHPQRDPEQVDYSYDEWSESRVAVVPYVAPTY